MSEPIRAAPARVRRRPLSSLHPNTIPIKSIDHTDNDDIRGAHNDKQNEGQLIQRPPRLRPEDHTRSGPTTRLSQLDQRSGQHADPSSFPHNSSPAYLKLGSSPDGKGVKSVFDTIIEDTPSDLRDLERGWRERRKIRLSLDRTSDQLSAIELRNTRGDRHIHSPHSLDRRDDGPCHERNNKTALIPQRRKIADRMRYEVNSIERLPSVIKGNVRFTPSTHSGLLTPPMTPPPSPKRMVEGSSSPDQFEAGSSDSSATSSIASAARPETRQVKERHRSDPARLPGQRLTEDPHARQEDVCGREKNVPISTPSLRDGRPSMEVQPILAHPLPPTSSPISTQRKNGRGDTIFVYPSSPTSPYELSIMLRPTTTATTTLHNTGTGNSTRKDVEVRQSVVVHVVRGGERIKFVSKRYDRENLADEGQAKELGWDKPRSWVHQSLRETREIRLADCERWQEEDKRDWENVRGVVDELKRITPRARYFHPLGQLTITCSNPPDVFLVFHLSGSPARLDSGSSRYATLKQDKGKTGPLERDARSRVRPGNVNSSDIPSIDWAGAHGTTNIRIMYSRLKGEVRIDTSSYPEVTDHALLARPKVQAHNSDMMERFRTKRMIPISRPAHIDGYADYEFGPARACHHKGGHRFDGQDRRRGLEWKEGKSQSARNADMRCEEAGEVLGIECSTSSWLEEEKEGLRRLWDLRHFWTRWDDSV